ncbi:acetyl-CoA hydrolase/transferase C-terminal domain-containing protein [Caballeronia sp. LZ029]|uniref:acetyl-CoA hydrolase/transferase family protein n=1 Tax=Caballeronia sp. LZ029 TaxID=3038564 RepID=UPI00285424F3|nr:acetyl-CoA hydrolase/transferase C-terminal domain-containing protein [Caballeronia sp. LZ029]MDR5748722.1 acetyl-CoA hydrolase/transferase C-terminal domain-containing protein [Caballeronia sp. LZ029]
MTHYLDHDSPDLSPWIRRGDTVLWGQANAEPLPLTRALMAQRERIGRFRVLLGIASSDSCRVEHTDYVDFVSYGGSGANRKLTDAGVLDVLPCHYSQLPALIREGSLKVDVLLLQVAGPDEAGRYSLSLAHEYLLAALDSARVVIAEVNRQAPWAYGEQSLTLERFDAVLLSDRPVLEQLRTTPSATEQRIGQNIAEFIEDGATLQMGIGTIPEAVLGCLTGHRDLGVHSGSIGDGVARLMASGVITNARKTIDSGKTVAGVLIGSAALHSFVHRNPNVLMRSTDYVHHPDVLASIDRLVAINSAIEVDLTGQVNAEVANGSYLGAVGGAGDFLRGAARSRGGVPVIALPSTSKGRSRIVERLSGPVSTPRCDIGLVVTEFGIADLRGLSLRQRTKRMLDIAHPDFRAELAPVANV